MPFKLNDRVVQTLVSDNDRQIVVLGPPVPGSNSKPVKTQPLSSDAFRPATPEEIRETDLALAAMARQGRLIAAAAAVRVAPASARELAVGPDGLEVLALGTHSPGDGEMVTADE